MVVYIVPFFPILVDQRKVVVSYSYDILPFFRVFTVIRSIDEYETDRFHKTIEFRCAVRPL